jgi:hypothetical protein
MGTHTTLSSELVPLASSLLSERCCVKDSALRHYRLIFVPDYFYAYSNYYIIYCIIIYVIIIYKLYINYIMYYRYYIQYIFIYNYTIYISYIIYKYIRI